MAQVKDISSDLTGQLLVAMPSMNDHRFERAVIYVCSHSGEGAMGLIVNKILPTLSFPDLMDQLDITVDSNQDIRVHVGGPVEEERGFVLHSADYVQDSTIVIDPQFAMTATVDILRDIAHGSGPAHSLLALGYAGWGAGQLDQEILDNGWLTVPADEGLVFGAEGDKAWEKAFKCLGFDPAALSGMAGHA